MYSFVYIREDISLIYYNIPKCASSTIRHYFFDNDHSLSMTEPASDLDSYKKITFVRNPWDRMVSNWKMFTEQEFRIRQLASMTSEDLSDFGDFVRFAKKKKNHHWQPQHLYLPDNVDFIGRLECFDEDLFELCELLDLEQRPAHRRNATKKARYPKYYDAKTSQIVYNMYRKDIEKFEYKF